MDNARVHTIQCLKLPTAQSVYLWNSDIHIKQLWRNNKPKIIMTYLSLHCGILHSGLANKKSFVIFMSKHTIETSVTIQSMFKHASKPAWYSYKICIWKIYLRSLAVLLCVFFGLLHQSRSLSEPQLARVLMNPGYTSSLWNTTHVTIRDSKGPVLKT